MRKDTEWVQFVVDEHCICYVGDPCYDAASVTLGLCFALALKPGVWHAQQLVGGAVLRAWHTAFADKKERTEDTGKEIGVDSGKISIFNWAGFPGDEGAEKDTWYAALCAWMDEHRGVDVVPFMAGIVMYTKYGDGTFPLYTAMDQADSLIVALEIDTDPEESDEEEEDEEDEDDSNNWEEENGYVDDGYRWSDSL